MLSRWPIRRKLTLCFALLIVALVTLSWSGITAIYKYRALARGVSRRSQELPLASGFARQVADMRVTFSHACQTASLPAEPPVTLHERGHALDELRSELYAARETIHKYKLVLQLRWARTSTTLFWTTSGAFDGSDRGVCKTLWSLNLTFFS